MKIEYKNYLNKNYKFSAKQKKSILFLIMIISGFFGFLYEIVFYYFNSGMTTIYWRGGNFIPWLDIYALGGILIYFLCYKKRKKPLTVFLISGLSCGLLEYLAGLLIYLLRDGYRAWNYNTEILSWGSINGFVCLRSVLVFALCGLILIYIMLPLIEHFIKKGNEKIIYTFSLAILSIILIDEFYNLVLIRLFPLTPSWEIYTKLGLKYLKS